MFRQVPLTISQIMTILCGSDPDLSLDSARAQADQFVSQQHAVMRTSMRKAARAAASELRSQQPTAEAEQVNPVLHQPGDQAEPVANIPAARAVLAKRTKRVRTQVAPTSGVPTGSPAADIVPQFPGVSSSFAGTLTPPTAGRSAREILAQTLADIELAKLRLELNRLPVSGSPGTASVVHMQAPMAKPHSPDSFTGKGHFESWLMGMSTWLRICEVPVTKMVDMAASHLRDEALRVWQQASLTLIAPTFEQFSKILTSQYGQFDSEITARAALRIIRMERRETVQDYNRAFRAQLAFIPNMDENTKFQFFMHGLPADLQTACNFDHSTNLPWVSFDAMTKFACMLDRSNRGPAGLDRS